MLISVKGNYSRARAKRAVVRIPRCVCVGIKFNQKKNYCVAVADGVDSDFPNVVIEIVDTVDRRVSVTTDGNKIMGV